MLFGKVKILRSHGWQYIPNLDGDFKGAFEYQWRRNCSYLYVILNSDLL